MARSRRTSSPRHLDCAICGKGFFGTHSQAKYCSPECSRIGERASWRAYNARNKERRNNYHREMYRREPEATAKRVESYRKTEAGKKAQRTTDRRQRELYPEKYKARQAVNVAVRSGTLAKQPCTICGDRKAQAHHLDYSRPLDVVWLCEPHHREQHGRSSAMRATETSNQHAVE